MTKNEKAAMLAELKALYKKYYRTNPKNSDLRRTICGEISAVQYVLYAGLQYSMEKEEIMKLLKELDEDAKVAVTSEKQKGYES